MDVGEVGLIARLDAESVANPALTPDELERRLLEMGFVEGALVSIRHQGAFGRDPIAVQVDEALVALRRSEAMAVWVSLDLVS